MSDLAGAPAMVRSIESLKKEAKQLLAAVRAGDASVLERLRPRLSARRPVAADAITLRDVQHALARELGFDGWASLMQQRVRDSLMAARAVSHYEDKAVALLEAYRTGTPEAMERHWSLTWHRRAWSAMRSYVRADLGLGSSDTIDISLDDARWLVAREHGFEHWIALVETVTADREVAQQISKPLALLAANENAELHTVAVSRHWDEFREELREADILGVDAHGQMTDDVLRELAADSQVREHITVLRLSGSAGVTDAGVATLTAFPRLQQLDLSSTNISDAAFDTLRTLPQLTRLGLSWTRTTDRGAQALATAAARETLEMVDLNGSHCGNAAIAACRGMPRLKQFLSGAQTTDAGLAYLADFPVYREWRGGEESMALLSYDAEPNKLMLRGQITDAGIAQLRVLDGLFGLNVDDSALGLTGAALSPLIGLPHLSWLAFDAKDDSMPLLAQLPHLRFLGCQDTAASDAGWAALGASRSIEHIWGRRCHGLGDQGFRALARLPRLRNFAGSCRSVSDTALSALPSFPALRQLMPMDVPDAGYRHIARCTELETLTLMYCRETGDEATQHIAQLPKLTKYFASYTQITDRTPALLSTSPSLESITFDSCAKLTNAGIAQLTRLSTLRDLRISGRGLTRAVVSEFSPGVRVSYSL